MEYRQLIRECTDLYEDMKHIIKIGEKEYQIRSPYMPEDIFKALIKSAILDILDDYGEISNTEEIIEHLIDNFGDMFRVICFDEGYTVEFDKEEDPTKCKIINETIKIGGYINE